MLPIVIIHEFRHCIFIYLSSCGASVAQSVCGSPSFLSKGYRECSGRSVKLTTYLHLVPRLRMRGAILPLPHTSSWIGTYLSTGTTLRFSYLYSCIFCPLKTNLFWKALRNGKCLVFTYIIAVQGAMSYM
jgi:hypothetical protein